MWKTQKLYTLPGVNFYHWQPWFNFNSKNACMQLVTYGLGVAY